LKKISTKNGDSFSGRLIIGCDGGNSIVKKHGNITSFGWSYNQMGLVCTLEAENDGFTD